jgi:L-serine dehydratase
MDDLMSVRPRPESGEPITTSLFELFKVGPGPSSSHTLAPMKAGLHFIRAMRSLPEEERAAADRAEFRLYGSLSATGKGHGTDRALAAGLQGYAPEDCPPDLLDELEDAWPLGLDMDGATISAEIVFAELEHDRPWSNTITAVLFSAGKVLLEREYYSTGGGFLRVKDEPDEERGAPTQAYSNARELLAALEANDLALHELILANEAAITGMEEKSVYAALDGLASVMEDSVDRGLSTEGVLPGPVGLERKAAGYLARANRVRHEVNRFLLRMDAAAHAAAEENAAGHVVVTAPTSGSAGVMPAAMHVLKSLGAGRADLRRALLAAATVGFLVKHNAGIAGAEVGCQGEIGTASAMSAAALAYGRGRGAEAALNAAEIALEHHLGLTCDPVMGYVQIPCIERNAMGAVKAYNAYLLASLGDPRRHKVGLDAAVTAMALTGRDMSAKYKETAMGGLALSVPQC